MIGDRSEGDAALGELDELYRRGAISNVPAYCRALILVGLAMSASAILGHSAPRKRSAAAEKR